MENALAHLTRGSEFIQTALQILGGAGSGSASPTGTSDPGNRNAPATAVSPSAATPAVPVAPTAPATPADIRAAEDRLLEMSTDPLSERDMEHLINPATGSTYTDAEIAAAIDNAEFRQTPYNELQQVSSHNSYDPNTHDLDISEQFEQYGIHSFELDIHAGDAGIDWLGNDDRPDGDYPVYHDSVPIFGSSDSHHPFLSDGLDEIAGLPNTSPITLFVDLKGDPLGGEGQMPADFDALLHDRLGDKLFTPEDMMARAPGANNLQEAIAQAGWPTVEELDGRVMVVLTGGGDGLQDYLSGNTSAAAFIAPNPDLEVNAHHEAGDPDGIEEFHPDPNAIFYNSSESGADASPTIHDQGSVTRVYGFDQPDDGAQATESNHLGTDDINSGTNNWDPPESTDPFIELSEPGD